MQDERLNIEDLVLISKSNNEGETISHVSIIGAGVMGQGIAQTISAAGIETTLIEKSKDALNQAKENLIENLDREIKRWALTAGEKKAILSRLKWSVKIEDAVNSDVIIEAVDENYDLKISIFKTLDKIAKKEAIFVSNTSTLSLSQIAESTSRSEQVIGMHFLNPVPKVPLVELVKGRNTSNETVKIAKEFATKIGKTAVEVYEYPGFVTTRAIVPLLNEAMYILLEDIATAKDIDTAMRLGYNFQYGPLEMADIMGLDEVLAWMDTLWRTLGEPRYRACPILRKLVREKKLGKKTGEGFYKYDDNGKIIF